MWLLLQKSRSAHVSTGVCQRVEALETGSVGLSPSLVESLLQLQLHVVWSTVGTRGEDGR